MLAPDEERHPSAEVIAHERPELLIFCGVAGFLGSIMPLITIFWGWQVTSHDFIADTVSDLARGEKKWIMDVGFYVHAGGLMGLALAAAHAHLGRLGWTLGLLCLAFLALVVVMLGLWDEFGGPASQDMSVHTQIAFFLGPLFLIGPLTMAAGTSGLRPVYGYLFIASAVLWAIFAVGFKLVGTDIDGLLEKIGVASTLLWTIPLSWIFFHRGIERME